MLLGAMVAAYAAGFSLRANERQIVEGAGRGYFASDGVVRMRVTLERIANDPEAAIDEADIKAIGASLRDEPLNSKALAVLGYAPPDAGGSTAQKRLMVLADQVSRREPLSQIWLIEDASASGDVRGAIRHYHAALSVQPSLHDKLMPILAAAIDFPEVREALRPLIVSEAKWMPTFISLASTSSKLDSLLGLVMAPSVKLNSDAFGQANANIVFRLVAEGRSSEASQYARRFIPGYQEGVLSDLSITPATLDERLGQMAWSLTDGDQISAKADAQGAISVTIQPAARGAVMSRFVSIASGLYEFRQTIRRQSGLAPASLRWQASCVGAEAGVGAPFWSQLVPTSEAAVQYRSNISVPSACRIIKIDLLTVGPESQLPTEIIISNIGLGPH